MKIDIHTHIFPDKVADKAIALLSKSAQIGAYHDGTLHGLKASMNQNDINVSVLLPVATAPGQVEKINERSFLINETHIETGIMSFGAIHPDCDNIKKIINDIDAHGLKGIKIHPVSQKVYFDDIRYLRILDYAFEKGLYVITHAGYDISFPGEDYCAVPHLLPVLDKMDCSKLILAHMGGWGEWDMVYDEILGRDVYIDTAFSLIEPKPYGNNTETIIPSNSLISTDKRRNEFPISQETFLKFVKKHGSKKILFGTDSPWDHQGKCAEYICTAPISDNERADIMYRNAYQFLNPNPYLR